MKMKQDRQFQLRSRLYLATLVLLLTASAPLVAQETKPAAPPPESKAATPNDPRQAQLLADTERLLKLSQELKAEVDKSTKDTLSLAVIKKAEEVERLAKSIKERLNKSH